MSDPPATLSRDAEPDPRAMELYRMAFARLNFQDEYLFKFSTVYLTANGALGVFLGSELGTPRNYWLIIIVAVVGISLSLSWILWTRHNDYWHSVWTGALRDIEGRLGTEVRLFARDHRKIAAEGGRSTRFIGRGHTIATIVPACFGIGWLCLLVWGATVVFRA